MKNPFAINPRIPRIGLLFISYDAVCLFNVPYNDIQKWRIQAQKAKRHCFLTDPQNSHAFSKGKPITRDLYCPLRD